MLIIEKDIFKINEDTEISDDTLIIFLNLLYNFINKKNYLFEQFIINNQIIEKLIYLINFKSYLIKIHSISIISLILNYQKEEFYQILIKSQIFKIIFQIIDQIDLNIIIFFLKGIILMFQFNLNFKKEFLNIELENEILYLINFNNEEINNLIELIFFNDQIN